MIDCHEEAKDKDKRLEIQNDSDGEENYNLFNLLIYCYYLLFEKLNARLFAWHDL